MPARPASSPTILERPSPNHGPRAHVPGDVSLIVIHYTGMPGAAAAIDRLTTASSEVSAHYVVDESGAITRLVPEDRRAWHAGRSFWRGIRDVNSASIGIELVNPGHEFGYRDFPDGQVDALIALIADIRSRHTIAPRDVVGHSDVAPGRKMDPGERFPWARLASAGYAIWPMGVAPAVTLAPLAAAKLLSVIGYASPQSPELGADVLSVDHGLEDGVAAFQRRFRPARIDGALDPETAGLISAIAALTSAAA